MEVSNEIKEDIRKTQTDLKNAIRVHQVWVARLEEDRNNIHFKSKVQEAEKDIIAISHTQDLVVDRLRRELELYQQRLKSRNKQINIENDNHFVAQQLRDHQLQYRNRTRTVSLLKPSVLNEIQIKTENCELKDNNSDSDNGGKSEKENSVNSDGEDKEKYTNNFSELGNSVHDSRNSYTNTLNQVKEVLIATKQAEAEEWNENSEHGSDSESPLGVQQSPTPSPPPLPGPGETICQETFMRLLGLITPSQKETLEKKRSERKKRATTSTNRNDFLYGNFDMLPKRKKYNQFPYLQTPSDPPQTRSAKLRKQKSQNKSSREGSPSGSSSEKGTNWGNKPAWASSLPDSLSVEPVYSPPKKICQVCGRNDVTSLLVCCGECGAWQHTGCGAGGRCAECRAPLPDPEPTSAPPHLARDKIIERKALQEKNIKLSIELRKLETRAATLKDNLDEHNAEKRQLLADQIETQRNLQKLLDFISQFKETSISVRSTSISESGSEISKSNED